MKGKVTLTNKPFTKEELKKYVNEFIDTYSSDIYTFSVDHDLPRIYAIGDLRLPIRPYGVPMILRFGI